MKVASLLLGLFFAMQAHAADVHLGGRAFTDFYYPSDNSNGFLQSSGDAWLEGRANLSENFSAKAVGDFRAHDVTVTDRNAGANARLREGYVDYSSGGTELRLGEQIVPWGKSDGVNPTDFLTAKDYTFFNPDDETKRLGAPALLANYALNAWTFTFFTSPDFAKTKLLIPSAILPAGVTVADAEEPNKTANNSEFALKAAYGGSGWDASLSLYRGWNHTPMFHELSRSFFPVPALIIAPEFQRETAIGQDFSWSREKWTWRMENAYTRTANDDATNPTQLPSHFDSVIGFEHPVGDDFRLQVQHVWRYLPHLPATSSDFVTAGIERANALLLNFQRTTVGGATVRFSWEKPDTSWKAEILAVGHYNGGDFFYRPSVTYLFTDTLQASLGTDQYGGKANRPLSALKGYSSYNTELKYVF